MGIQFGKQKMALRKSFIAFVLFFIATSFLFPGTRVMAYDEVFGDNPAPLPGGPTQPAQPVLHPGQSLTNPAPSPQVDAQQAAVGEVIGGFNNPIYRMMYGFVLGVFGTIFGWSGAIFDVGLNKFLLGFGDLYYNHNVGVAVEETWKIVRDLFNLTFIFGLVYIGFKMILDADDHNGRKMLVNLIGAALLVNFSLFIIKFLIDISDITASVIANGFRDTPSISNAFINVINLGTILKLDQSQFVTLEQGGGAFTYIFGIMIFFAVASFVFAAGGILLMIRFIVLNIYLVFSPVMFIGWVFPSFAHHSKKYIDGFLGQAFFAPAYLLMLYLSFKVLSTYADVQNVDYGLMFASGAVNASSAEMAIPFFILAMIFLVASLVVAKNMGAVGASTAVSIGDSWRKKITGGMQNAALAPLRFGARTTTGFMSTQSEKLNNRLQSSSTGRGFKRAVSIASLGTFTERERLAAIEAGKKAKFGGAYSYSDDKKFREETQRRTNDLEASSHRHHDYDKHIDTLDSATASTTDLNTAFEELQKTITSMTADEKEHLGVKKLTDQRVAVHLTDADIEGLNKTGHFAAADIQKMKDARKAGWSSIATNGYSGAGKGGATTNLSSSVVGNKQRAGLANRSIQDIGKMPVGVFKQAEMAEFITPQMVQERMRNGGILTGDLTDIRDNIKNNVINKPGTDARVIKMWRTWSDNNTFGAQLGLF